MSAESVESIMAEVEAEARSETGEQQEKARAKAQQAASDDAAELAAIIQAGVALVVPIYPKLEAIYTETTCQRLGTVSAALMAKYGYTVGGFFERWGVEIAFLATVVPVGIQTAKVVRESKPRPEKDDGRERVVNGETVAPEEATL